MLQTTPQNVTVTVDRTSEYNVKGTYLYYFARYVTWPESSAMPDDGNFHVGVVGDTGVVKPLRIIAKAKTIQDRRTGSTRAIRIHEFKTSEECTACQILFVSETAEIATREAINQKFSGIPVLIVGETRGFAQKDGTAEFLLVGGGIRFDLNVDAANERGLTLDAKLLKAANAIVNGPNSNSITRK